MALVAAAVVAAAMVAAAVVAVAVVAAAVVVAVQRYKMNIQQLVSGNNTFDLARRPAKKKYRSDSVHVSKVQCACIELQCARIKSRLFIA